MKQPCCGGGTRYTITVYSNLCKRKYKDSEMDSPATFDCPGTSLVCYRVYEICWNDNLNPPDYEINIVDGPTITGDLFSCPRYYEQDNWQAPDPSGEPGDEWSGCYTVYGMDCLPWPD